MAGREYPRYQLSRAFKFVRHTGTTTFSTTSWANFNTATDITLEAEVGDVLYADLSANFDDQSAVMCRCNLVTVVAGSPVNGWDTLTTPVNADLGLWFSSTVAEYIQFGLPNRYTVVAGDISGGLVTVRIRGRMNAAGSRGINVDQWALENRGPVDPS